MQHLVHVTTRCYELATKSTPPRLTQRTVKTRISIYRPRRFSNAASSPRNDSLLRTALALQQLAYVRLAVQASNQIDTPRLTQRTVKTGTSIYQTRPTSTSRYDRPAAFNDSTNLSCPQRSFSSIQRLDQSQLPATIVQLHSTTRPTSTSCYDRPAAFNDSADLSCPQRSSGCIQRLDRRQLTHIKHPVVSPRLDLRQLTSSNVQLHSTTRLISASSNDHPAASTTRTYQLSTPPI